MMYRIGPLCSLLLGAQVSFVHPFLVCTDSGVGHVGCSIDGGIPLHPLQKRESGMAAVPVLRERCDDYAQRYSGE